jgi:hypothetical protein
LVAQATIGNSEFSVYSALTSIYSALQVLYRSIRHLCENETSLYALPMVAEFFRLNWTWVAAWAVAAFGVLLAVLALFRSGKALQVSIPEPEVRTAHAKFTIIRMRPSDEHRFAISRVASRGGKFLVTADVRLRDLPDIVRGYLPLGRRVRSAEFDPPATSLVIRTAQEGSIIKACIISRADPRIHKWVKISV